MSLQNKSNDREGTLPSRVYNQIKEIKQLPKQMSIYTKLGNRQVNYLFHSPVSLLWGPVVLCQPAVMI